MIQYSPLKLNNKIYYVFKKGNTCTLFQQSDEFEISVYHGGLLKLNNLFLNTIRKQNIQDAIIYHYEILTDGRLILKRTEIIKEKK